MYASDEMSTPVFYAPVPIYIDTHMHVTMMYHIYLYIHTHTHAHPNTNAYRAGLLERMPVVSSRLTTAVDSDLMQNGEEEEEQPVPITLQVSAGAPYSSSHELKLVTGNGRILRGGTRSRALPFGMQNCSAPFLCGRSLLCAFNENPAHNI